MRSTTTAASLPPLSHLQWRAPEWISAFGPLTKSILMDYFVLSPFFDPSSNNATLRMQIMFSRQGNATHAGRGLMDGLDEERELKRFKGIEYVVVHDDAPGLFIIHKRDRQSPTQAHTTAAYHVLNDSIYQAPSLYQVVNERLLASLHALSTSLGALKANQPNWSTERGAGQWKIRQRAAAPPDSSTPTNVDGLLRLGASQKRSREDEAHEQGRVQDEHEKLERHPSPTTKGIETPEAVGADVLLQDPDLYQRPPETFNPLLFNALDRVARELVVPVHLDESKPHGLGLGLDLRSQNGTTAEVDGGNSGRQGGKKEDDGSGSGSGSAQVQSMEMETNGTNSPSTTTTGNKSGKNKVVQAANGKRLPRKALQAQAVGRP
ncbi:BQ2448_2284 [Microbotryum intermedium]|uniref:Mediator of RNA polymerase II transcription subunit 6 n=1 Tax=Microbotryum intermedium TaxID=269621 RepID=A0A238FBI4_9BASI|nr:BQ2448_2284 [Microbotryum intermedium]